MRLSVKVILATVMVVVVASSLLDAFFGTTLETFLIDQTGAGLVRQARLAALTVGNRTADEHPDKIADFIGDQLELRVTIIDADGIVTGDSRVDTPDLTKLDNHGQRPEVLQAMAGGLGRSVRFSDTLGIQMLYVAGPVPGHPGEILRLAIPMSELQASRNTVQGVLWASLLGGMLAVSLTTFGLSRFLTRHITYLAGVARRMSGGEFDHQVEVAGVSVREIQDLGKALNEMRIQTQERLEQVMAENSRLEAVLSGISEGIMVTERNGRIRMTNGQFDRLFGGGGASGNAGRMPEAVVKSSDVERLVSETLESSEPNMQEIVMPGVIERYLDVHAAPIMQNGEVIGTVTVFYDISEIRRLEQIREDFIANVSHELRTPLTTIKGCAATLADGALSDAEAAKRFVDSINAHAGRLHSLVDDLLDLSHLESDQLHVETEVIDLREVVESVRETTDSFAEERQVVVRCDIEEKTSALGDMALIRQAVTNLLDNAIKYTEVGGSVTVSARRGSLTDARQPDIPFASPEPAARPADEVASGERIYLEVTDTGLGIPSENLPRIFERFYRVDKGRSRAMGGTGLGLAIVRHIIESHGERVFVRSELGKGSTFGFSLLLDQP